MADSRETMYLKPSVRRIQTATRTLEECTRRFQSDLANLQAPTIFGSSLVCSLTYRSESLAHHS